MPPTAVAKVNGTVVAESDLYEKIEGNIYFPPATVNTEYLKPSDTKETCLRKGQASYYDVEVDGEIIKDGAWSYLNPKDDFDHLRGFVAFSSFAPLMIVMRRLPLRFHKNKPDMRIDTIAE